MQANVVGRCHGHQALHSGEGHRASFGRAHKAAADAILAVVLCWCCEDAVRTETLHGHGHTVCEDKKDRLRLGAATTVLR